MPPELFTRSAFYPFCSYSPEWQAMQLAKSHNAQIQFIDQPWHEQVIQKIQTEQSQSLLAERYLQHSQYIQQLARKLHCRDHDEVWEHLFELKALGDIADWQSFFQETLIWCAMARLDYEPESLEAEGSSQREQHMLTAIRKLKKSAPKAKIVVVTGGFHTLALLEGLWQNQLVLATKSEISQFNRQQKNNDKDDAWLIRYSFDRLDSLNGYASGMMSPAYYQASCQAMLAQENSQTQTDTQPYSQTQALHFLSEVTSQLREKQNADDAISFVALRSAIEQACLLSELRGYHGPGRYDLLDGLQSAFIKGSISETRSDFWRIVQRCFSGSQLGKIPLGTTSPPLVNEVYSTLQKYRFKLDDTLPKTHIDIYRKPEHRERSRSLHLLAFLDIGFARRVDGPDYIHGQRLNILFEDWQYAWTPMVEARLIELSEQGAQLKPLAVQKLSQQAASLAEQGQGQSCLQAAQGVIQAALMGLQSYFTQRLAELSHYIESDSDFASLVACGHRLLYLWQGRTFLDLNATPALLALLVKVPTQAFFLLDKLKQQELEQQDQNLNTLLSLRDLLNNLPDELDSQQLKQDFYLNLLRLQPLLSEQPLIRGAIDSISYLDAQITQSELEAKIITEFGLGSQSEQAITYFIGIMRATPELIIQSPLLLNSLDKLLMHWDQERFISVLPDLRYAFSQLTPKQNAQIAQHIALQYGFEQNDLSLQQYQFSEKELQRALSLELFVSEHIQQQQLQNWFKQ